jgi:hypothetical protein
MLHFSTALDTALSALKPLFEAYRIKVEERFDWVAKMKLDPDVAAGGKEIDEFIDRIGKESLHAISACIVVTGDNVMKSTAHATFRKTIPNIGERELRRRSFGSIVTGKGGGRTSFGAALYAGANAFRHSEEWAAGGKPFPTTKAVLDVLGVSCDDEACTQILELMTRKGSPYVASFLTLKDFEIEIEIAASQMWDAARKMAPA